MMAPEIYQRHGEYRENRIKNSVFSVFSVVKWSMYSTVRYTR